MSAGKRVKVVLAGCGGIAGAWMGAQSVKSRVDIVGLVDIREEATRAFEEKYGLKGVVRGTDLNSVLKAAKPEVVFDCSIPEAHCGVTLTALRHGCHVLGEKPMADSMANARKMLAAAKKAKRIYAVIQNRRYMPQIRALRKFLDSGAIGNVTTVHSDFMMGVHFGGFRDKMKHVLLLDMAIHTFDAARLICGSDAVSVYCHEWNPAGSWYDHDASAIAIFEMKKGIVYSYKGSWCAEGCHTSWECSWRITGDKGTVLWDGGEGFQAETVVSGEGFCRERKQLNVPRSCPVKLTGGHDGVIRNFLDCVRSCGVPETVCYDNIKSLAMVHSAISSAEKEKKVKVC